MGQVSSQLDYARVSPFAGRRDIAPLSGFAERRLDQRGPSHWFLVMGEAE